MKEDLRIVKTKKILYETLINLMKEKTFEEIKVSDICKQALINRSTFYSHYNDKYDLFMELINSLKENLFNDLNTNTNNINTKSYYMKLISLLLDHIEEKKEIYYSILLNNRNSIVVDIILDVVTKDINKRISIIKNKEIPTDIVSNFYLGGVSMLGIMYLQSNNKYSKENILKYLDKLIIEDI